MSYSLSKKHFTFFWVTVRLLCATPLPDAPRNTEPKVELNPFVSTVRPPANDGAPATALLSIAPKRLAVKVMPEGAVGIQLATAAEVLSVPPAKFFAPGEVIFERNAPGSSLFGIASGSVAVEVNPADPSITIPIEAGSIFGEVGLISDRRRGATIVAAEDTICVEISRNAALKLQSQVPTAKRAIERISTERQILQMFGSGLTPADITEVVETAKIVSARAGEAIINEGDEDTDIYVIRVGSMIVEKEVGGKPVFLSYLPAGSYVGEMALIDGGRRTATVRAAIKSEVIRIDGEAFGRVLAAKPALLERARKDMEVLFDSKVMLNLWVKVKGGWSDDERALRSLGYGDL